MFRVWKWFISSVVFFMLFCAASLPAQTEIEETLLEENDKEEASEILEQLQQLRQHPINLNTATRHKLQTLPVLSPLLAEEIIRDRKEHGPFLSITDLRKRLQLEKSEWQKMKPYVTLSEGKRKKKKRDFQLRWRHQVKYPLAAGYKNGAYLGSIWKEYQRLVVSPMNGLRMGILLEKDAGEIDWSDHMVGYLETEAGNTGKFTAGNFRAEFGQGLVLWGPYGFSKGGDAIVPVKKRSRGILGYAYSDENSALTGGAWQKSFGPVECALFHSHSLLDAAIHEDGTVTNFHSTGYHRTAEEIIKKNQVKEILTGGRLTFTRSFGTVGVTGWWNHYSRVIDPGDPERKHFDFIGDRNYVIGMDFDLYVRRWNFSGELAYSRSGGWAVLFSTITKLGGWTIAFSVHHYDPRFQNPHTIGTAEVQNEQGVYFGVKGRVGRFTQFSLFYDMCHKPWRTYFTPVPTRSNDLFLQLNQKITHRLDLLLRIRYRQGEQTGNGFLPSGQETDLLLDRFHNHYRIGFQYRPNRWIELRNRLETVTVSYPENRGITSALGRREKGFLLYQDIRMDIFNRIFISLRLACFDTPSYDSRISVFENDLPGVLTNRPLYGRGIRWFVLMRCPLFRYLELSTKYSRMIRYGVSSLGSGNDRIDGNMEQQLSIQGDVRF